MEFAAAVPEAAADAAWGGLVHALGGLFCSSLSYLDSPRRFVRPRAVWDGRVDGSVRGPVRYGSLPQEGICTENLTPWFKLLPCRDQLGLAALLRHLRQRRGEQP